MVALTGCPCFPNTSQNTTGQPAKVHSPKPSAVTRASNFGELLPACEIPERSPFTSAANTGTPIELRASAITCSVTVFPVPVAPATKPCRFVIPASKYNSSAPFAIIGILTIGHLLRQPEDYT